MVIERAKLTLGCRCVFRDLRLLSGCDRTKSLSQSFAGSRSQFIHQFLEIARERIYFRRA
jgi:hypothetical protein